MRSDERQIYRDAVPSREEVEHIETFTTIDKVVAKPTGQRVAADAAQQSVIVPPTVHPVITFTTLHEVIALVAVEAVRSGVAQQDVVAGTAYKGVVNLVTNQHVGTGAAREVLDPSQIVTAMAGGLQTDGRQIYRDAIGRTLVVGRVDTLTTDEEVVAHPAD